jgi:Cu+-exporting ATPase
MDFLIAFGAVLTYIYSLYVLYSGNGHSYFDSVAMIITFVLVGKYLEVIGKKNANDTIDTIKSSIPYEATRIKDNEKEIIGVDAIEIGDIIEVKNGQKACVDGKLISEYASFDQSSISGESVDVVKQKGDTIYSSTINTSDVVVYEATSTYANSTFNSIIELLENSLNTKPKIQDITNELSKNFSLIILLLSIATFTGWYIYNGDFENALVVSISVIVIACPCALALATPIASLIGISWMSQKGVLLKDAKLIEMFNEIDTIVLDKTGTITKAQLEVVNISNKDLTKEQLNILYTLTDSSTHLVSMAIKKYLSSNYDNLEFIKLEDIKQIAGVGIDAKYNNHVIYGGKSQDINSKYTSFEFKIDNKSIVKFDLQDSIKEDALQMVEFFNKQNIDVIICSGDNEEVVKDVATQLGIKTYKANMKPQDKYDFINELKEQNKKVAMVGDGVNDTLALSKADISISMASGSDISINVSDVVILNNSLKSLINSFYISKRTYKFIKQNLSISLIYNALTIPIAMAGYVVPLFAALSMSLSSLLVVGNSFRIKKDIK